jgi:hypothetical protein
LSILIGCFKINGCESVKLEIYTNLYTKHKKIASHYAEIEVASMYIFDIISQWNIHIYKKKTMLNIY